MRTKIWHVNNNRGDHPKVRDSHDNPIATIALGDTLEETHEIANLIAAAPAMFEACEAISEALIKGELMWKNKRQADSDPYHPANVKLCAAIAQAKGQAV